MSVCKSVTALSDFFHMLQYNFFHAHHNKKRLSHIPHTQITVGICSLDLKIVGVGASYPEEVSSLWEGSLGQNAARF